MRVMFVGCPDGLDTVKFSNGSVVYCNPDPAAYGPGDFYHQFPSCHPSQSCLYRFRLPLCLCCVGVKGVW